jgi:hypothetical protein
MVRHCVEGGEAQPKPKAEAVRMACQAPASLEDAQSSMPSKARQETYIATRIVN